MGERARADLLHRGREAAALAQVRLDPGALQAPHASAGQLQALRQLLAGAVEAEAHTRAALGAAAVDTLPGAMARQRQALLALERVAQVVEHLVGQRRDPHRGLHLQWADAFAQASWQVLLSRLPAVVPRPPAPPLVWLEPCESAATLARRGSVATPLLAAPGADHHLSLPIVLLPPDQLPAPWHWAALPHELGHDLDGELGLETEVAAALARALGEAGLPPRRVGWWVDCAGELVADAVGLLVGGEGLAWALLLVLRGSPLGTVRFGAYPPPVVRLELLAAMLRRIGAGSPEVQAHLQAVAESDAVSPAARDHLAEARGDVDRVATALLEAPLPTLGGAPLRALAGSPGHDLATICALSDQLSNHGAPLPTAPLHLVPAAAARAAVLGADLPALAGRCRAVLEQAELPEWVVPADRWELYTERVRRWLPTIVADRQGPTKVPPVELMAAARRMAFVGATHHQLAAALDRAFDLRHGQRWELIEVYFVEGPALAAMAHEGCAAEELLLRSATARAELLARLPQLAEEWGAYSHEQPFLFASYWDWERPGGRIHVSCQVWGQDIARCPSLDHTWPHGTPPAEYLSYRDGLDELRRRARRLGAS